MQHASETTTEAPNSTAYMWVVLVAFVVSFFLIEHHWEKRNYYANSDFVDYAGDENKTADAVEGGNRNGALGRLLLAAVGAFALLRSDQRQLDTSGPLVWIVGGLFMWLCCTIIWSIDRSLTFRKLIVLTTFAIAALGVSRGLTRRQLCIVLPLGAFTFSTLGFLKEVAMGTFSVFGTYRFTGTIHPNSQAMYGVIVCLAGASFVSWANFRKLAPLCGMGVGLCVVALTRSRSALVATAIGLSTLVMVRTRGINRILLFAMMILAMGIGLFGMSTADAEFKRNLTHILTMGRTGSSDLTGRVPLWELLLEDVSARPILGYGYLAYWDAERVEALSEELAWEIPNAHNSYLDIALDAGLIGLLLFVTMLGWALITALRDYARTRSPATAFILAFLVSAIADGMAESFFKLTNAQNFVLLCLILSYLWTDAESEQGFMPHEEAKTEPARRRVLV